MVSDEVDTCSAVQVSAAAPSIRSHNSDAGVKAQVHLAMGEHVLSLRIQVSVCRSQLETCGDDHTVTADPLSSIRQDDSSAFGVKIASS